MGDFRFYVRKFGFVDALFHVGMWSLILYRLGHVLYKSRGRKVNPLWYVYLLLNAFFLAFTKIELPCACSIGRELLLPHPHGLVMGPGTVIGDGVTIGPWALFGHNFDGRCPTVGNNCYIGAKASLIGNITIGEGAIIGVNAVVSQNVPAGAVVSATKPMNIK